MNSKDLKRWQLERILRTISPALRYVSMVAERAEQEFPPNDQMRQKTQTALAALQALSMELHRLSCERGMDKPKTVLNNPPRHRRGC